MSTETMELIVKQLEKEFGKGSVFSLTEEMIDRGYDSISTGSISLDHAVGNGGLVKGRVIEVYGGESSGKTTLLLHILKEALKDDEEKNVAFIDVEHALDSRYVKNVIGDNYGRILFSQPDSAENALNIMDALVRSGGCSVIALDSVAGLAPRAEIEGEIGDSHIAIVARLMSQTLRKVVAIAESNGTLLLFANQVRDTIGPFAPVTPGGRALKFYASVRIELRNIKKIKEGDQFKSIISQAKVQKNKTAPPYRIGTIPISFGSGISVEDEVLTYAADYGLIDKRGTWFSYNDTQIGQGRASVIQYLKDNPDTMEELVRKIKEVLKTEN